MASKYLRHGETYCGDGTTSAAAASSGGVGAWNNINVFNGTAPAYGALVAGDTVYIRSKDAAGADITVTQAANIGVGSSAATFAAPITWVLDDGTVWSGISGVLTYDVATANYSMSVGAHNIISASAVDALVFKISYASYYANWFSIAQGAVIRNAWFRMDAVTLTSTGPSGVKAEGYQNGHSTLINCRFSVGSRLYGYLFAVDSYATLHLVSPRITLSADVSGTTLFKTTNGAANIQVFGGEISGTTANQLIWTSGVDHGDLVCHGTIIPANVKYRNGEPDGAGQDQRFDCWGADGGVGSFSLRQGGVIDSRQDGYYPYLNGVYPNSLSQGWSWKLYPSNAYFGSLLSVVSSNLFTDTAAAKTVTLEMLVSDSFVTAGTGTKGKVWAEVSYVDNTTGLRKSVDSLVLGSTTALDASTAAWSATSYGPTLLIKKKIALTTPTAIKKDTLVITTLYWSTKSVSVTDIVFVDPDPQLT